MPAGKRTREVLSTVDILPTVCHVAGVAAPGGRVLDGKNIWGVLTGGTGSPHEFLAWANGAQLAIRKGRWKLVVNGADFDGTEAGAKALVGEDAVFLFPIWKPIRGSGKMFGGRIRMLSMSCRRC